MDGDCEQAKATATAASNIYEPLLQYVSRDQLEQELRRRRRTDWADTFATRADVFAIMVFPLIAVAAVVAMAAAHVAAHCTPKL
jgi:hypothetical protein